MGIDPALYSKELCVNISKNFEIWELSCNINQTDTNTDEPLSYIENNTLTDILVRSVDHTKSLGSSTITALLLDNVNKVLYSAFLGDSAYMILRLDSGGKYYIFFKSEDQTHGFNAPFQVGHEGDNPQLAKSNEHKIQENDLILLATDGYILNNSRLWDNLDNDHVLVLVNNHYTNLLDKKVFNIQELSNRIASEAEVFSNKK